MPSAPTPPIPNVVAARRLTGQLVACYIESERRQDGIVTSAAEQLELDQEGIIGSRHRGWLRRADARTPYIQRGTPIRNTRMLSLVSVEDLALAAERLSLVRIDPRWIGANLLVADIHNFSYLPRGSKLHMPGGSILTVEDQNAPCRVAGRAIADQTGVAAAELGFAKHAKGLRGVVASVEWPATISTSGPMQAVLPEQWIYS